MTDVAPAEDSAGRGGETPAERRQPALGFGNGLVTAIAVVAALYLGRAFFVPLLIGILASYALCPFVDWLQAARIPRAIGAALVLAVLLGAASWGAVSLQEDAAAMIHNLPEAARKVRQHLGSTRAQGPTAMQKIQEAATEIQGAAAEATGDAKAAKPAPRAATLKDAPAGTWLRDYAVTQSALIFSVAAQAPIVLLLAYFLLASGNHFRRKLVQVVGPSLTAKKDAVRMLEEIDTQVQRYLLVTVVANILLATATWVVFELLGVEQAGVWGIAAGVLHFVPYLGPVVFAIASGLAGFMQFGSGSMALAVAGSSLLVAAAIGTLITTWVQSRFSRVNAAVLFIALLFFGWLWGIWGLLLGAPLLAIIKVVCDRVDALNAVSELIGH